MKTIKINTPKGKEAHDIVATPHSGYIEVSYELKDSWKPKDGDFIKYIGYNICCLVIYKQEGFYALLNKFTQKLYMLGTLDYFNSVITPTTEEEKQQLLDALHKKGKDWDAENKKIVPYRWKPNEGDVYYYITYYVNNYVWADDITDNKLYDIHNCFQTKEEAEAMLSKIQKVLNGAELKGE